MFRLIPATAVLSTWIFIGFLASCARQTSTISTALPKAKDPILKLAHELYLSTEVKIPSVDGNNLVYKYLSPEVKFNKELQEVVYQMEDLEKYRLKPYAGKTGVIQVNIPLTLSNGHASSLQFRMRGLEKSLSAGDKERLFRYLHVRLEEFLKAAADSNGMTFPKNTARKITTELVTRANDSAKWYAKFSRHLNPTMATSIPGKVSKAFGWAAATAGFIWLGNSLYKVVIDEDGQEQILEVEDSNVTSLD